MSPGNIGVLQVRPFTESDAHEVATWRYDGPWATYDVDEPTDVDCFWAVVDSHGALVGYYCTGSEARVPGLESQPGVIDIGVGMHPDLVGVGNGRTFAEAILEHCRRSSGEEMRAVVQSWNERSLRLAAAMGFHHTGTHVCVQGGRPVTYTIMVAPLHPNP